MSPIKTKLPLQWTFELKNNTSVEMWFVPHWDEMSVPLYRTAKAARTRARACANHYGVRYRLRRIQLVALPAKESTHA